MNKKLTKSDIKVLGLSSLGGMLEFYDFIIFTFFATVLSGQFFPVSDFWSSMNYYITFAAGYFARPLGGIVMAHFGDKFGRKKMFMLSLMLMIFPTLLLGILPTYEHIGILAPLILIAIRILQGIAIGGELPGAWVFVSEHVNKAHMGFSIGILTSTVVGGIALGSIVNIILSLNFTKQEIYDYAWRFPFILGGVFGLISVYLRRYLSETPVFKEMQLQKELEHLPIKAVFQKHKVGVVISLLSTWMVTACVIVVLLFMPNILGKFHIGQDIAIYLQLGAIFFTMLGCIVGGFLSDKFGLNNMGIIFAICFGAVAYIYFYALMHGFSLMFIAITYMILGFFGGISNWSPMNILHCFPSKVLFSGLSFSYNLAYAILGGITPILVGYLINTNIMYIGYYLILVMILSIALSLVLKQRGSKIKGANI